MTDLLALLETHQHTRLLRMSFPRDDGPHARLMVNRLDGSEYLSRDFAFSVEDNRRGRIEYRYDPIGRLLAANSAMGHETFAFDPAGNIQAAETAQQGPINSRAPRTAAPSAAKSISNMVYRQCRSYEAAPAQ